MACFRCFNNFNKTLLTSVKFTKNLINSANTTYTADLLPWLQTSRVRQLPCVYSVRQQSTTSTTDRKLSSAAAVSLVKQTDDFTAVVENINSSLRSPDVGRLFAVVHVAGKQRKVTAEDIIVLDKPVDADIGTRIRLNKVLMVGGRDFTLVGRPILSLNSVRVEATVIEKTLSHTNIIFWYKRRKNHRYLRLRREALTYLRINDIDLATVEQ